MKLHELHSPPGSHKSRKRVGRGPGSGQGGTAGRGNKGQKARSGGNTGTGFEGGQMPLQRRLPKRGFTNQFKKRFALVNIQSLERFEANAVVDPAILLTRRVIKRLYDGVKVLGKGTLTKSLTVKAHRISASARQKIEAAGGKVEVL